MQPESHGLGVQPTVLAISLFIVPGLAGGQCFSHADRRPLCFMCILHTSHHEERQELHRQRGGKEGRVGKRKYTRHSTT